MPRTGRAAGRNSIGNHAANLPTGETVESESQVAGENIKSTASLTQRDLGDPCELETLSPYWATIGGCLGNRLHRILNDG
jgi:hypothetical protein